MGWAGVPAKERKMKKKKNTTEARLFAAEILLEVPAQIVTISIEQGFGWCSGKYKWFVVAAKAEKIEQREPAQTEEEARSTAIQWCALAEYHGVLYQTDIILSAGAAPQQKDI